MIVKFFIIDIEKYKMTRIYTMLFEFQTDYDKYFGNLIVNVSIYLSIIFLVIRK